MTYTPITKLDKFNDEKDNTQVWLNNIAKAITTNNWDDARVMQKTRLPVPDFKPSPESRPIPIHLPAYDAPTNLSTTSLSNSSLLTTATSNLSGTATKDATTNNSESNSPQTTLTNNILPAMVTENESLAAIFFFKLEETINPPLFSGAALKEKPITTIYTNAKVNGHPIKLILDSGSAGSIITRQLMDQLGCRVDRAASVRIITADEATKTLIGKIDDFPIKVNGITIPIKVLVMEATQYQAFIGNNWLSKTNTMLD
ncbi:hypothetical protein G9A89_002904 [Geosiphon pyriformis]|nr:hypothetical protein G9A89_002904 [Geosiphon pyriformis]